MNKLLIVQGLREFGAFIEDLWALLAPIAEVLGAALLWVITIPFWIIGGPEWVRTSRR